MARKKSSCLGHYDFAIVGFQNGDACLLDQNQLPLIEGIRCVQIHERLFRRPQLHMKLSSTLPSRSVFPYDEAIRQPCPDALSRGTMIFIKRFIAIMFAFTQGMEIRLTGAVIFGSFIPVAGPGTFLTS